VVREVIATRDCQVVDVGEARLKWLMIIAALAAAVAIFMTTPRGAEIARKLGLRLSFKDTAPKEDRDYLLKICGGDTRVVAAMLDAARIHDPDMSEKDAYRKAIRAHLRDKM